MLCAPVAGAFAHRPRPSDFLLVRSSAGALSVRRLTGSLVLGQQEPQMRIPAPKSKESKCEADLPSTVSSPLSVRNYRLQYFDTMLQASWGLLPAVLARCSGVSSEACPCGQRSKQDVSAQGHPGEQAGRACVPGAAQKAAQDRQGQGRGQRDSVPGAAEKELCIAVQL